MSNGGYKSEDFNGVDWSRVEDRIEGERVVLAADVAKEDFVARKRRSGPAARMAMRWRGSCLKRAWRCSFALIAIRHLSRPIRKGPKR